MPKDTNDSTVIFVLLGSGINYINVLCTAFALVDPESVRTQLSCQYLFTLLGSMSIKAVRRMLMKFTLCGVKAVGKMFVKLTPVIKCSVYLDIDECSDRSSCGREASCQNAPGTYKCSCFNASPFNPATRYGVIFVL